MAEDDALDTNRPVRHRNERKCRYNTKSDKTNRNRFSKAIIRESPNESESSFAMKRLVQFGCAVAIALAACLLPLLAAQQQPTQPVPDQTALTSAQIQDLLNRVIANQHRNDVALDTFERLEHHVERNGSNGRVAEDKLYRVVPTEAAL